MTLSPNNLGSVEHPSLASCPTLPLPISSSLPTTRPPPLTPSLPLRTFQQATGLDLQDRPVLVEVEGVVDQDDQLVDAESEHRISALVQAASRAESLEHGIEHDDMVAAASWEQAPGGRKRGREHEEDGGGYAREGGGGGGEHGGNASLSAMHKTSMHHYKMLQMMNKVVFFNLNPNPETRNPNPEPNTMACVCRPKL